MHFDAIWPCFYSSLWFLHFLTTFFRSCQKAILRVHVWKDMDCGVTQAFSLLKLARCHVTSVRAVLYFVMFLFYAFLPSFIDCSKSIAREKLLRAVFKPHCLSLIWKFCNIFNHRACGKKMLLYSVFFTVHYNSFTIVSIYNQEKNRYYK